MEKIRIQTATGLLIGNLIDDDVKEILEDQRRLIEENNSKLNLAGKVEIF